MLLEGEDAARPPRREKRARLAAWGRGEVDHDLGRRNELRHRLCRDVDDRERPGRDEGVRGGVSRRHRERERGPRRAHGLDAVRRETPKDLLGGPGAGIRQEVDRRVLVVGRQRGPGRFLAECRDPTRHEPFRMRRLEREPADGIDFPGRTTAPGRGLFLGHPAENGVDEARRLRREAPHRGDGLADRGVRRHAIHEKELGSPEAKRREDRRLERLRRLPEMSRQDVVEADGAPKRLFHERAQKVAVARRKVATACVQERRCVRAVPGHAHENSERPLADGPRIGHQPQRSPGATRSPRTNSAAGSARRPSTCSVAIGDRPFATGDDDARPRLEENPRGFFAPSHTGSISRDLRKPR